MTPLQMRLAELFPAYMDALDYSLPPEWLELLARLK